VKKTTTEPVVRSVSDIHLAYIPFSHSTASGLVFAVAGYVIARPLTNSPVLTMPVGTAVVSHLILDLYACARHAPGAGIDQPKLGLGLYGGTPFSAIVIENVYGAFCWWMYQGSRPLLVVILLFNVANLSLLSNAVPARKHCLPGAPC